MTNSDIVIEGTVLLATPRGFCAGVVRAIDIVNLAIERFGAPLYVRREIVHNKFVVNDLRQKGAEFIDDLDEVPEGSLVIFSAHGVSPEVRRIARERRLLVIDATCPLVTKVHLEAIRYARGNYTTILIGHEDHDEVIGTTGEAPASIIVVGTVQEAEKVEVQDPSRVAYITQTTLSLDDTREIIDCLRRRFPAIEGPAAADICYATQNRQQAVLQLASSAEVILVVGSKNSSNSNRLVEVAQKAGRRAYLIDDIRDIQPEWLSGIRRVGLTAGASAPENLVSHVIEYLAEIGYSRLQLVGDIVENVEFALPPELSRGEAHART